MAFKSSDVPQANRPDLVVKIAELACDGALTLEEIGVVLQTSGAGSYVERQARYYRTAAIQFGLVEEVPGNRVEATDLGHLLHETTNRQERLSLLRKALVFSPLVAALLSQFQELRPTTEQIGTWLKENTDLELSTCARRASSISAFISRWYFGSDDPGSLESTDWTLLRTRDGNALPEWAQAILDLGRLHGLEESGNQVRWHLLAVPHRNLAAALYGLGFLEATISELIALNEEFDITELQRGHQITWHRNGKAHHGTFLGFPSTGRPISGFGPTFDYQPSRGGASIVRHEVAKANDWNFRPYFGDPFVHPRNLSRNYEFFETFFGSRATQLMGSSFPHLTFIGRPALRADLLSEEFLVGGLVGCLDDLIRVDGINNANEVAHFLARYVSPDTALPTPFETRCAIFDGYRAYPSLKNYVVAPHNAIFLDRKDLGSVDSVSAFESAASNSGTEVHVGHSPIELPGAIEHIMWSKLS